MGSGTSVVSECQFILYGMRKDGWEFLDEKLMQSFLDNPRLLDVKSDLFLEAFYKYFDWYWRNQRSK